MIVMMTAPSKNLFRVTGKSVPTIKGRIYAVEIQDRL
jgi:hypothetical protein